MIFGLKTSDDAGTLATGVAAVPAFFPASVVAPVPPPPKRPNRPPPLVPLDEAAVGFAGALLLFAGTFSGTFFVWGPAFDCVRKGALSKGRRVEDAGAGAGGFAFAFGVLASSLVSASTFLPPLPKSAENGLAGEAFSGDRAAGVLEAGGDFAEGRGAPVDFFSAVGEAVEGCF